MNNLKSISTKAEDPQSLFMIKDYSITWSQATWIENLAEISDSRKHFNLTGLDYTYRTKPNNWKVKAS